MIPTRSSLLPARKYARRQRREIVGEGEEILNNGVFSRKYGQGRAQVRAGMVASTCGKGCMCVEDTVHCEDGCSALQERLHCTASETGKRDTKIVSPIQDKRKGKKTVAFLTAKFTSKNVM